MRFSTHGLLAEVGQIPAVTRLVVAYSGGMDSHVLLHALHAVRDQLAAPVTAVHVHHGLQTQADHWVDHCRGVCQALQIPLHIITVDARARPGHSPEAEARQARYQALQRCISRGDCLLTAHHQDDQAETLLLQLLRGSGPKGLAGMPVVAALGDGRHARPLLAFGRAGLLQYAVHHRLHWVEDPSNTDTGLARNFIRHEIMPHLRQAWPAAAATLSRSARLCAEAAAVLEQQCVHWLTDMMARDGSLSIDQLQQFDEARQGLLLQHWLKVCALPAANEKHIQQIRQAMLSPPDRNPEIRWQHVIIRRYRGRLYATMQVDGPEVPEVLGWHWPQPLSLPSAIGGQLHARRVIGRGLRTALLPDQLEVRFRHGGERCRPAGRAGHHVELKKLLQQSAVPPWLRRRWPLIYVEGQLAAVAGICDCEPFQATGVDEGVEIQWLR
ncbi:MAG: tRNA lysidine(34) synthetase TilS [Gammaproteobacteria bacterium]|nr:tRNA lysidine(34) synthetase TilS [Gammaproteobacteria bacterium]